MSRLCYPIGDVINMLKPRLVLLFWQGSNMFRHLVHSNWNNCSKKTLFQDFIYYSWIWDHKKNGKQIGVPRGTIWFPASLFFFWFILFLEFNVILLQFEIRERFWERLWEIVGKLFFFGFFIFMTWIPFWNFWFVVRFSAVIFLRKIMFVFLDCMSFGL